MAGPADAAARLRGLVLSSEALSASAAAQGEPNDVPAAQTALLQLHSLLSVTAAAEPASRRAADSLLQQCTARLHGLTMQRHRSEARWAECDCVGRAVCAAALHPSVRLLRLPQAAATCCCRLLATVAFSASMSSWQAHPRGGADAPGRLPRGLPLCQPRRL